MAGDKARDGENNKQGDTESTRKRWSGKAPWRRWHLSKELVMQRAGLRRPERLATVLERTGPPARERSRRTTMRTYLPFHRLRVSFTRLPNEFLAFFSWIYRSFLHVMVMSPLPYITNISHNLSFLWRRLTCPTKNRTDLANPANLPS